MANIAVIVDEDSGRRSRYLAAAARVLEENFACVSGRLEHGSFGAVWSAAPSAPIRTWASDGSAALIVGDALDDEGHAADAEMLAASWLGDRLNPSAHDGFYAAVTFDESGLVLGCDRLGLFPLFYASTDEVLLAATMPGVLQLHPQMTAVVDMDGLVETLLFDCPLGNRTLWRGVHRLEAGHALVGRGGSCREVMQFAIPRSSRPEHLSYDDQIRVLDDALGSAIARHAGPDTRQGILLSGGRDSRMIAGYLHDRGVALDCLTMGERRDFETMCAARVSRILGATHGFSAPRPSVMPHLAELHASREELSSGFSSLHQWGLTGPLRELAPRFASGHVFDFIAGGAAFGASQRRGHVVSFERMLEVMNERGIPVTVLTSLLQSKEDRERVAAAVERMRHAYHGIPCESERRWRHQLATTERIRVGSAPWRLSFGAWPFVPALDRRLIELAATLPMDTLATRRAQDEIMRRRFPELASVPLVDRNAGLRPPVTATAFDDVLRRRRRAEQLRSGWRRLLPERRVTWRLYDFNGAGWQAIRAAAEPHRDRLAGIFHMDRLADYLPLPGRRVSSTTFFDTMGRKLLIGLMLTAARRDI